MHNKTVKLKYKCRLCGELFFNNSKKLRDVSGVLNRFVLGGNLPLSVEKKVHQCNTNTDTGVETFGIADLVGYSVI